MRNASNMRETKCSENKRKLEETDNIGHRRNDITSQNKNTRTLEVRTLTGIIQDGGTFDGESRL